VNYLEKKKSIMLGAFSELMKTLSLRARKIRWDKVLSDRP